MDDGQLLMQFFKKRDSDNNMKLDGLELLSALVDMEGEIFLSGQVSILLYFESLQKMKIIIMASMVIIKRNLSIEKSMSV